MGPSPSIWVLGMTAKMRTMEEGLETGGYRFIINDWCCNNDAVRSIRLKNSFSVENDPRRYTSVSSAPNFNTFAITPTIFGNHVADWYNHQHKHFDRIHYYINIFEFLAKSLGDGSVNVRNGVAGSTGHRNTARNLSAGVSKSKVFRGR